MNLTLLREARGWRQEDLAEKIGVHPSTISRAESMHPSAKLETYAACAKELGVTLGDLFAENRSVVEVEFLRLFRQIDPSRHDDLRAAMRLALDPSQR